MTNLPGPSIPRGSAVFCMDCDVVFDTKNVACPKCGSSIGVHALSNGLPGASQLIETQRNLIDEAEGVLLTVSKRRHGPSSALCARMVDRIRVSREKGRAPASTSAPIEKEVPVQ